jgi:hypothetical protein
LLFISKDVSESSVVVFVIICHWNSQSRYSQPNFLRFVNTIFHSYVLCLFHHSLIKCSCNYQVYFTETTFKHAVCVQSYIILSVKIRRSSCANRIWPA